MRRKTIKIKRDVIEHGNRRTQRQKGNQHGEKTDIIHETQNTEMKLGQTGRERKLLSSEDHRKQNWKALENNIILTSTKQSLNTDHILNPKEWIMSTQKLKTLGQRYRTMTTSSQIMMLVSPQLCSYLFPLPSLSCKYFLSPPVLCHVLIHGPVSPCSVFQSFQFPLSCPASVLAFCILLKQQH